MLQEEEEVLKMQGALKCILFSVVLALDRLQPGQETVVRLEAQV